MPAATTYRNLARTPIFRIVVAVLFGLIGFSINFLDIQILDTAEFKISILLGLFFPMTIALAWGWRYGLLSALAGGCQSMWWLWQGDGWGVVYAVPVFTVWIVWHGWWADVREQGRESYPWYHSAFLVEIPFRLVSELGFLTIFAWLVALNPPWWAPELSWNEVSLTWIRAVAIKHTISGYIILLLSYVVISLAPVRTILGLRTRSAQNEVSVLYAVAILLGLALWLADATLLFWLDNGKNANFWDVLLFDPGHHLFIRIAFMFLALCGAASLSPMLRSRARLRNRVLQLNRVLDGLHRVSKVIDNHKEPHELMGSICEQLNQAKGYRSVSIVRLDAGGKVVDHRLSGPFDPSQRQSDYFRNHPLCPCILDALERRDLVVAHEKKGLCKGCPFKTGAAPTDTSTGCFCYPIIYRDTVYGVLTATLSLNRLHDRQEQYLFKEIGADIAFSLYGLEEEAKRRRAEEALLESEQRFNELLENVPEVAVQGYGPDGTVHYWNRASEIIYGYSREEAVGSNLVDLIIPENMRDDVRKVIAEGAQTGKMPPPHELTLRNKRGEPITVLTSHAVVVRSEREPELYCIDIDLRRRKQTESRLQASQAEIQSIFRSAPVGIGLNKNRVLVRVNTRLCEMLGYTEDELVGRPARMLYPAQEEYDFVGSEKYAQIERTGTGRVETRFLHKNGSILHVILSSTPLDLSDLSRGVTFTALDISDRKRAEEALRESQERLRTTLYSIGDAVITTDEHARVATMNPVAETMTGWKHDQAKGLPLRTVFAIVSAVDRKECENPAARAINQGEIVGLANHTVLIAKDGSEYHIADSAAPIRDLEGTISGAVLVFRDITKEYRMRRELQKMDKLESLGNLAGGLAHDFNNILMAIYGNIELASSHLDSSHPAKNFLSNAEQSMDRATRITNKLLTFSKGGSPMKERLSLGRLLPNTVDFDLSGSGVEPVFHIEDDLRDIEGDKSQLEQVISNLTINARQAMEDTGSLEMSLSNDDLAEEQVAGLAPGPYVKLIFQDTGPGIADENIGSVFDPYFTTHMTGSGLGLATVYSIVSRHGGTILAESPKGRGARFTVYLPALEESHSPSSFTPVPGRDAQAAPKVPQRSKRILIMDDEPMIQDVLTALLGSMRYEVVATSEGREAVEAYQKAMEDGAPFDAVILDLTIPGGMGGAKTIQELLHIDPNVRGIVSSGYTDDPVIAGFQAYGFKGVVIKPYTLQELRTTLDLVVA